ncbi:hypothetical protein ACW23B_27250 [Streptomyces albidoflavus]
MAAESGKWAEKHTDEHAAKETPVENYPRPETRTAPREAAPDVPGAGPAPRTAPRPTCRPRRRAPSRRAPSGRRAPSPAGAPAGQATVKPQPLAGKNTADPAAGPTAARTGTPGPAATTPEVPVFGAGEGERWSGRRREAVNGFVDRPREAVAEADEVFAELAGRVTEALAEQRRVLRSGWEEPAGEPDTERLRVALQSYREASERLLRL